MRVFSSFWKIKANVCLFPAIEEAADGKLYGIVREGTKYYIKVAKDAKKGLVAENFDYIFGTPLSDEDTNINKVKTALLIIQKDHRWIHWLRLSLSER